MHNVKCNVSNCRYWKDNKCEASEIEVNIDSGVKTPNVNEQTNCHTFDAK